ncbi:Acetyltransferase (GNAT) domain-containing protein [Thermoflavimicrobium dichotomicum]|uniref:Acetyltransferase (GNAT) domain-containing protein n=2 Tax=Thermoflavimicrobium dichotomicum TaxID=46223 RepID=A0A1I3T119_9BACL|nr:Acetyltransferase (GNAT) domain-containing protein [Thermoflavimicrobium dichotomicum]
MISTIYEERKGDYLISTDRSLLDLDVIHRYLSQESYWAKGIARDQVARMIEHSSLVFGLYYQNRQIGFARVMTDTVRFAYLADVFVLPEFQGKGLGKWLVEFIVSLPEVQVKKFLLATRDAHSLYAKYGFEPLNQPEKFMRKLGK